MIYVGIDDTDTLDSPGTNQLARTIVMRIAPLCSCHLIVRHQLLFDPRIPYTSKNGSASLLLEPRTRFPIGTLIERLREIMQETYFAGSDPGLCVATEVPPELMAFGKRCQREIVTQQDAREIAREHGVHLEGIGGTEGGVIGALAAVGLVAEGDDGRVVQQGEWPDDLSGVLSLHTIQARGVAVRRLDTGQVVSAGIIDIGKKLRPNRRKGGTVLFVEPATLTDCWKAVKLT